MELLGTFLGKILGVAVGIYFLLTAAQSVSIYVHHIIDFMLPETPFPVITVIHILVICYLVWHGPEVIARIGVFGFIAGLIFTLLVFLPLFDAS
ncbi:MAG: GerAB/ArcD/ProY family transporter, partial [Clostridia bacterium]|nr:GerAB/ArcD/ProY family transporter [Clostridia bacterium]